MLLFVFVLNKAHNFTLLPSHFHLFSPPSPLSLIYLRECHWREQGGACTHTHTPLLDTKANPFIISLFSLSHYIYKEYTHTVTTSYIYNRHIGDQSHHAKPQQYLTRCGAIIDRQSQPQSPNLNGPSGILKRKQRVLLFFFFFFSS